MDQSSEKPLIQLTEAAKKRIDELIKAQDIEGMGIRIAIQGQSARGFQYHLGFQMEDGVQPNDVVVDCESFKVFVDPQSAGNLQGATLDYVETPQGGGFEIDNPNHPQSKTWDDPTAARIQELFDREINPAIASHGGFVELIDVKEDQVFVRLGGGCRGCGMVNATLKQGIERRIREVLPQIQQVVDVTNHAEGTNPYYQ